MYFDEGDIQSLNSGFVQYMRQLRSQREGNPYGTVRRIPTHTEDGIPIRKVYVSNLPPKTTRAELFNIFTQFGFIKKCWLKMPDSDKKNKATYAFITYENPTEAFRALSAQPFEKSLRGWDLNVSPADSWHQPTEDSNGVVQWHTRNLRHRDENSEPDPGNTSSNEDLPGNSEGSVENTNAEEPITKNEKRNLSGEDEPKSILDILNVDCLTYILGFIPLRELILTERVSKEWCNMLREYYPNIREFKTSCWPGGKVPLTTAVLRHILERVGMSLRRLQVENTWCTLNDRAAHAIGKFCPELEELEIINMHTKNWNPISYGCKKLRSVSFLSCNKVTDISIANLVKYESNVVNISLTADPLVTGLFLTKVNLEKIQSLTFSNCPMLQIDELCASAALCQNLTTLKLDSRSAKLWSAVLFILQKVPQLVELSLSGFRYEGNTMRPDDEEAFVNAVTNLSKLKRLDLHCNMWVTNAVLKRIAQTCPGLEQLNVAGFYSGRDNVGSGVGDVGIVAVCRNCTALSSLDVSNLPSLTNSGLRYLSKLSCLTYFSARANRRLTAAGVVPCLGACPRLKELDLSGCQAVNAEEVYTATLAAVTAHPRRILLKIPGTNIEPECDLSSNKFIHVETLCTHPFDKNFEVSGLIFGDYSDEGDDTFSDDDDDDDDDFVNGILDIVDVDYMDDFNDFMDMVNFNSPELVIL